MFHPEEFGRVLDVAFHQPGDLAAAGELAAALTQHRAAVVVRSHLAGGLTTSQLADRVGTAAAELIAQLDGRRPMESEDLFAWAFALDDPTVARTLREVGELLIDRLPPGLPATR